MKKWFEREREKLQGYSAKEKAEYIWQYYWLWIVGIAAAVGIVIYMAVSMLTAVEDTNLYVAFLNSAAPLGEDSEFWEGYVELAKPDLKHEAVSFDTNLNLDLSEGAPMGDAYFQKLVVLLDGGTADAVVMERESFDTLAQSGRLIDLRMEQTAALMERYADRIITIFHEEEDGTTREIPVGIDVSDSILVTRERAYEGDCVLGISANAKHMEALSVFLGYLFGEEG